MTGQKNLTEFERVFRSLVERGERDVDGALRALHRVQDGVSQKERSALFELEADLHERRGDLTRAKECYTLALPDASAFGRALILQILGRLEEKDAGRGDLAVQYYRRALRSLEEDSRRSAGFFLTSFLRALPRGVLSEDDQQLVDRALERSWSIRGLPGAHGDLGHEQAVGLVVNAEREGRRAE